MLGQLKLPAKKVSYICLSKENISLIKHLTNLSKRSQVVRFYCYSRRSHKPFSGTHSSSKQSTSPLLQPGFPFTTKFSPSFWHMTWLTKATKPSPKSSSQWWGTLTLRSGETSLTVYLSLGHRCPRPVVSKGYKFEFKTLLPHFFQIHQKPPQRVVPVPPQDRFKGFYLNLLMVPKPKLIIFWIKSLNRHMASMDLHDAYLHVPICPPHQHFLTFVLADNPFKFVTLPSSSPFACKVFAKISACTSQNIQRQMLCRWPSSEGLISLQAIRKCPQDNLDAPGLWLGDQ